MAREILVFFHVFGAIMWIGAGLTLIALRIKVTKTNNKEKMREAVSDNVWLSRRLFMPAGIITLLSGVTLVGISKRVQLSDLWVIIALVGIFVAILHGAIVVGKLGEKLEKMNVKDKGFMISYAAFNGATIISLTVLLAVLLDMVIRPKTDNFYFYIWSLFVLVVCSLLFYRKTASTK